MTMQAPIDDRMLSAWLDGELAPGDAARVDAWLTDHPEDGARVRGWAADREALRAAFAPMLAEPVPARLAAVLEPRRTRRRALRVAGAAALLIAGMLLGAIVDEAWHARPATRSAAAAPEPAAWVRRAAYAHAVYAPEQRHPVEVRAQEEHLARWLTRRIGAPVELFDLREQGFELIGGRLLPDGDGLGAQLMYQDAEGVRVTVYLRRSGERAETAFRYERSGELGLFYWIEPGCGYALVGPLPRERLLALAEAIYHQHPGAGGGAASAPRG